MGVNVSKGEIDDARSQQGRLPGRILFMDSMSNPLTLLYSTGSSGLRTSPRTGRLRWRTWAGFRSGSTPECGL